MQFCQTNSVAVIPYSPLEGGFLTGKYKRGGQLPNTPRAYTNRKFMTDDGFAVIDALTAIAAEKRVSVSAVALAWLLHRPAITAPIIGANSPAQLADLLPAGDLKLSDGEMQRLNDASEPFTHKQPS